MISRKGVEKHGQGEFTCQCNSRDLLLATTYITVEFCCNFLTCIAIYHKDNAAAFRTFGLQFIITLFSFRRWTHNTEWLLQRWYMSCPKRHNSSLQLSDQNCWYMLTNSMELNFEIRYSKIKISWFYICDCSGVWEYVVII